VKQSQKEELYTPTNDCFLMLQSMENFQTVMVVCNEKYLYGKFWEGKNLDLEEKISQVL
jgi:hypothetical protein